MNDPVKEHLLATAGLMNNAIAAFGEKYGDEGRHLIVGALQAGSMMRAVTTLSLAGTMAVAFELIAPNGEVINIGRVDFDSEAPMQH
mgnify:CR=1 FL=1